jgi:myo-inositol-1(or 4)-monophosphatase
MLPLTTFMLKVARKASRLLMRDYFELEGLQSSVRSTENFSKRSSDKVREVLFEELMRYPNAQIIQNTKIEQNKAAYFAFTTLDGATNLSRALPFFATTIIACEHKNDKLVPKACIINFPALGEIVYAEVGGGAFVEKIQAQTSQSAARLRVSKTQNFGDALITSSAPMHNNTRIFGCSTYGGYLVASGKIDVLFSNEADETTSLALELLVKEAGGRAFLNQELYGHHAKLILMNGVLK